MESKYTRNRMRMDVYLIRWRGPFCLITSPARLGPLLYMLIFLSLSSVEKNGSRLGPEA